MPYKNLQKNKILQIFRDDYMAWGLAEFDAERRGKKEGYSAGLSDGISQGIQQGISQGAQQKAIETAKNMLTFGDSIEKISQVTGLSEEEIKSLIK